MNKTQAFTLVQMSVYCALLALLILFCSQLVVRATQTLYATIKTTHNALDMLCLFDVLSADCQSAPVQQSDWISITGHKLIWRNADGLYTGWEYTNGTMFHMHGPYNLTTKRWRRGTKSRIASGITNTQFRVYADRTRNDVVAIQWTISTKNQCEIGNTVQLKNGYRSYA